MQIQTQSTLFYIFRHLHVLRTSAFDAVFVKVPQYYTDAEMHTSHGHCLEVIAVDATVYQVWVPELWSAANKHARDLVIGRPCGTPRRTHDLVEPWGRGDVTEPVAVDLVAAKVVLMPHL